MLETTAALAAGYDQAPSDVEREPRRVPDFSGWKVHQVRVMQKKVCRVRCRTVQSLPQDKQRTVQLLEAERERERVS